MSGDPDFEPTQPARPPEVDQQRGWEEGPTLASTLITLVKNVFGRGEQTPVSEPVAKPRTGSTYPVGWQDMEESFDSVSSEKTARAVRDAIARMERGEEPLLAGQDDPTDER